MSSQKKIAVLGAGPMGLAVAYQLAKDRYSPVVYEADDRVGGMTASFDFNGLEIERYYHFHCISDEEFFEVLKELQIDDKMNWVETKMGFFWNNKVNPWGNPIALLKFPGLSLISKFRYGLHAFLATKRENWKPLDRLEAISWIRRWVGNEAYSVLWQKLFDYKFYDYSNSLSAAWIWSRIRRIGRSRYNLFKEKLGYLDGGSNTLLTAMSSDIRNNGGVINLSQPVKQIVIEDGVLKGIETSEGFQAFDIVISTVPIPFIPKIAPSLPSEMLQQYQSVKNIAVVCIIIKLRKRLTENFWLNINNDEMDIPGLVEYSNLRPLDDHIVYVPFYMPFENPKYQDSDEIYSQKVKAYLMRINTDFSDEDFVDIKVNRYRYSQPVCGPEFLESLPNAKTPVEGLWIADTSYYYPEDRGISESIGYGRNMAKQAVQK